MNAIALPAAGPLRPKTAPTSALPLDRIAAAIRARLAARSARVDLDALPDRLRADIGLAPRETRPALLVPPVGVGRL